MCCFPLGQRGKQATARQHRLCGAARRVACRLDVCWTFFFFLFLAAVLSITSAITRVRVDGAMRETWHAVHETHVRSLNMGLGNTFDSFLAVAGGYLTLHVKTRAHPGVEEVMATLCSLLIYFDPAQVIRVATSGTFRLDALTACIRGEENATSLSTTWLGMASVDHLIDGVYYLDNRTFRFDQPPRRVLGLLPSTINVTELLRRYRLEDPVFNASFARFNGETSTFDLALMWTTPQHVSHTLLLTFPSMSLYTAGAIPNDKDERLFVRLNIDASQLLPSLNKQFSLSRSAAVFIDASLGSEDPLIMSNSWGQESWMGTDTLLADSTAGFDYLRASHVSDPLMRAALKHLNIKALQKHQYNESIDFKYNGAPATVTVFRFSKHGCPSLPVVCVSAQRSITPPYTRIMNICIGVVWFVMLVESVLFYLFIRRYVCAPLERVTLLLNDSVEAGSRAARAVRPAGARFQLSEVQALVQVSNQAMSRLREIDEFLPEARVRQRRRLQSTASNPLCNASTPALAAPAAGMCSSMNDLTEQILSVVYVRIQPLGDRSSAPCTRSSVAVNVQRQRSNPYQAQQMDAMEMQGRGNADHGPFSSSRAISDFITVVHTLCRIHHGVVHRLTPDRGILHFGSAVRTHFFGYAASAAAAAVAATRDGRLLAPEEQLNVACVRREAARCARQDAKDAVACALELQRWSNHYRVATLPDIRALVDTGLFSCGQYRPCGSEHTVSVAFGRDVSRDLGHVPASIDVRVAMTEETASRVRAGVQRTACATVAAGVRQLPVEAFRTGRVGLNADVVIVYEALPGDVVGNVAWQLYSRCCFDGFGFMLRGDYASALGAFKGVMDISDLEQGLLPPRLRREAAVSTVTKGAVSKQVDRLMQECERRIAAGITKGYYRERRVPLGIDAVLQGAVSPADPLRLRQARPSESVTGSRVSGWATTATFEASGRTHAGAASNAQMPTAAAAAAAADLCTVALPARSPDASSDAASGLPDSFMDSNGMLWYLPRSAETVLYSQRVKSITPSATMVLGSAGALCTLCRRVYATNSPFVAEDADEAPLNSFSEGICLPHRSSPADAHLRRQAIQLFALYWQYRHPNIIVPLSRAFVEDGAAAGLWGFLPGSTLRTLYERFHLVKPVTVRCLNVCVLTALVHLHAKGTVHGAVSLDNVVVDSNGHCRLLLQACKLADGRALFATARSCYVSPAMAAGHAPTPACDIFCYGLLCLEAATRRSSWTWSTEEAGQPRRTERQLLELMKEGGSAFSAAVVDGRVVPALERVDLPPMADTYETCARVALRNMLSYDPAKRPTAEQLWELDRGVLLKKGVKLLNNKNLRL